MTETRFNQSSKPGAVASKRWLRISPILAACILLAHCALAQQTAVNTRATVNFEYPQPNGKVAPLYWSSIPKWATIDMQARVRGESQSSDGYVSGNDAIYALTRVWGGLEVRPAKWLTGYLQFADAHALGLPRKYIASNQRNAFDGRQAFLKFHAGNVQIIAGRQELSYGDQRLIGMSNWTNASRSFDGFLGRIGDKNRLDLFSTSVVAIRPTSLDKHGAGLTFHGAVGTITTWVPHTVIQPFVYVKALPRVQSLQKTYGTETEVTPGVELSAKFPCGFYFDTLDALQRGSYANDSIRSAATFVQAGYSAQRFSWKPRLSGEYAYASGNPLTDLKRIGTFDQLYPTAINAFGATSLFGFENIKGGRVDLDLTPAKNLWVLVQQNWLRVATVRDSVYSSSGSVTVKAPAKGFLSDDLGREFDTRLVYAFLRDNLTLNAGVGHFSPGTLMRENAHGAPLTIVYLGLTYKFKVNHPNAAP